MTPSEPVDYSLGLTLAYVLAPLLAIPVGVGLFELTRNDTVAVVGAGLAVVAVPVSMHGFQAQAGRAAMTGALLPVMTLGALGVGVLAGANLGGANCDNSDCELSGGIAGAIAGGLIGGFAGYVGYAIYDVSANSASATEPRDSGEVRVWALPVLGRRAAASEVGTEGGGAMVGGAMVGATLAL